MEFALFAPKQIRRFVAFVSPLLLLLWQPTNCTSTAANNKDKREEGRKKISLRNVIKRKANRIRPSLLIYEVAESSPPGETPQRPRNDFIGLKRCLLSKSSDSYQRGRGRVGHQDLRHLRGYHLECCQRTGSHSGEGEVIVLTILEIRRTRERTALDESKFDLLEGLALDAGSFGEPVLGLLENLTLVVISKKQS